MKDAQNPTINLKDYRPPAFLVEHVALDFQLHDDHTIVTCVLKLQRNPSLRASQARQPLTLDGRDLELITVRLDGKDLAPGDYELSPERLTVHEVPDSCMLETQVRIEPQNNTSLEGLYRSSGMFATQCEAEGFRRITWYPDRPDVMSRFSTRIEADRASCPILLSNGNCIDQGTSTDGSRHWTLWDDPWPKPSYLFALVAGELSHLADEFTTRSGRRVDLKLYVHEKDLPKCAHAMTALKQSMRWDEDCYGREYDLDVFNVVAVDDFAGGAMENKSLNLFNTACVLASPDVATDDGFHTVRDVVAHEYFHNWSGNRVTCRDWFQLSLKEGFTVFREQQFSADMGSAAVKRIQDVNIIRTAQFAEDASPMAHPVRPDSYIEISNFYTLTVYNKGAEVVRMIQTLLGGEDFRKGAELYFERHDGQAVTTEEFVCAMEEASGTDLTQFRRWYEQAGTPRLSVDSVYDESTQCLALTVRQSCPPTPGQPDKAPFHIPLAIGLLDPSGQDLPLRLKGEAHATGTTRVLSVTRPEETFTFVDLPSRPVLSALRDYSAPVKLEGHADPDDQMFLMSHDSDGFNRWEAGQQLAVGVLRSLIGDLRADRSMRTDPRLIQAFGSVLSSALEDSQQDKAMLAQVLTLPTEAYLAELSNPIDVDAIHAARQAAQRHLVQAHGEQFWALYRANETTGPYRFDPLDAGRRALRNAVLAYLMQSGDRDALQCCEQQYRQADNLTERAAALRALTHAPMEAAREVAEQLLSEFLERWRDEPLLIDQWLAIQAGRPSMDTLDTVIKLTGHDAFSLRNPNKVRALIGTFASNNPIGFHRRDGAGYAFLADQVLALDALTPSVAARMVTPLVRFRRYDSNRQALMRSELERISNSSRPLSKDVYELVSKALLETANP